MGATPMSSEFPIRELPQCDQYTRWRSRMGPPASSYTGTPERLAFDVPEREVYTGDRLACDAARTLSSHSIHVPVPRLDRAWIPAEQDCLEFLGRFNNAIRVAAVGTLSIACNPLVGTNGDVLPGTPPGVDDEGNQLL